MSAKPRAHLASAIRVVKAEHSRFKFIKTQVAISTGKFLGESYLFIVQQIKNHQPVRAFESNLHTVCYS